MRDDIMSDFKSKLPDFKELGSMTSKLFKGIKSSVEEIIRDYKEKRTVSEDKEGTVEETTTIEENVKVEKKSTTKPAEKPELEPKPEPKPKPEVVNKTENKE